MDERELEKSKPDIKDDLEIEDVDFNDFGIDDSSFQDQDDEEEQRDQINDSEFDEGEEVDLSISLDHVPSVVNRGDDHSLDEVEEIDINDFGLSDGDDLAFEEVDFSLDDDD